MAYSVIDFRDRHIRVHDLDLTIACFLIMSVADNKMSGSIKLLFEEWMATISLSGSGCMDLKFNDLLNEDDEIFELTRLIKLAKKELNSFSDRYPKAKLETFLGKAKIKLRNNYRVDLINKVLDGLQSLFTDSVCIVQQPALGRRDHD